MGYNMKRGNSGVKFRELGSSPAKQAIGGDAGEVLSEWNKYQKNLKAKEFLKKNTVKPKPIVKPKGVLGPGTRPLHPKVTKDIAKVKNIIGKGVDTTKEVIKKSVKGAGRAIGLLPSLMLTPKSLSASDQTGLPPSDLENYESGRGETIK